MLLLVSLKIFLLSHSWIIFCWIFVTVTDNLQDALLRLHIFMSESFCFEFEKKTKCRFVLCILLIKWILTRYQPYKTYTCPCEYFICTFNLDIKEMRSWKLTLMYYLEMLLIKLDVFPWNIYTFFQECFAIKIFQTI